jgi:hypothetical protein
MYLFTAEDFRDRVDYGTSEQVTPFVLRHASFVDAFNCAGTFASRHKLVSERGFFNPGRREGLKLAFLEAAEQVPPPIDWYVQAVSSAMGVYGAFKGAKELLGLRRIPNLPRLLCVQQETCAPMARAFADGSEVIRPEDIVHKPTGIAQAILRGDPTRVYPYVRRIVLESNGTFATVNEQEIREARRMVEELEGFPLLLSLCGAGGSGPAGASGPFPETNCVGQSHGKRSASGESTKMRGSSLVRGAPEDPLTSGTNALAGTGGLRTSNLVSAAAALIKFWSLRKYPPSLRRRSGRGPRKGNQETTRLSPAPLSSIDGGEGVAPVATMPRFETFRIRQT